MINLGFELWYSDSRIHLLNYSKQYTGNIYWIFTMFQALHGLFHLFFTYIYEVGAIIVPILRMRKLKSSEILFVCFCESI